MKNECYCKKYLRSGEALEIFKNMKIIASTPWKEELVCGEGGRTNILECNKCNKFYFWNQYKIAYSSGDIIAISEYTSKGDKKGIQKILASMKGVVSEKDIEEKF